MSYQYVHLKCHGEYSISDGLLSVGAAVSSARDDGMRVAVTDFMNLFAWVKFYKKAVASGVGLLLGLILVFNDGNASRVTLLCQNDQGYLNLTELITKAYLEGQSRTGVPEIHGRG